MPFDVIAEASQTGGGTITSDRRLCLAEDGKLVVEADDPRACSLLCPAAGQIPADRVKALGLELVDGKVTQRPNAPLLRKVDEGVKEKEKPEDKQKSKPETKSATKH